MSSDFHFLVPESFHTKFGSDRHSSFWQNPDHFFLYVHYLGPRSRNSLDLQYSHIFICTIRCLLLLTFRSLAAIVSEKSTVFTFSYRKAFVIKFDHAVKKVNVIPGSSFEQTMMVWSPRCYIPSFMKIGQPALEKKNFKGFYHIWAWWQSWSCDQDHVNKF